MAGVTAAYHFEDVIFRHQQRENAIDEAVSQLLARTDEDGDRFREAYKQLKTFFLSEWYADVDLIHPLIIKVAEGDSKSVRALLDHNVDVNIEEGEGRDTPVIVACKTKSLEMVTMLLSYKANINVQNMNGKTPLMIAIQEKCDDIVQKLLSCGANIHLEDEKRQTALFWACYSGCPTIVSQLIERGANVNSKTTEQLTPLMSGCISGSLETVKILIKHGADINAQEIEGFSVLGIAVAEGHEQIADYLLNAGANVNNESTFGDTPLILASNKNSLHMVKELVKRGANVNHRNLMGETALHYNCKEQHENIVSYLLSAEENADPNLSTNNNETPLMYASFNGNFSIAKALLEKGADPLMMDKDGTTAFMYAVQREHASVAALLLHCDRRNSRPFSQEWKKHPPLHIACVQNDIRKIREQIHSGADVERRIEKGVTPLIICATKGNSDGVLELLKAGAGVNVSYNEGNTPLMKAVESKNLKTVEILLSYGADVNRCNKTGKTPVMKAVELGELKLIEMLLDSGADVSRSDNEGKTVLMLASKHADVKIVELLVSKGADVNAQDKDGFTALMMMSQYGHLEAAQHLVQNGADVTIKTTHQTAALTFCSGGHYDLAELLLAVQISLNHPKEDGWTPLHFAASKGFDRLAKHLLANKTVVDAADVNGVTPLMLACERGYDDLLLRLIGSGGDINRSSSDGQTPVHKAVAGGHYNVLRKLTNRGARVDCVDKDNRSPLIIASLRGNVRLLSLLLLHDLDIDRSDSKGWTPLMLCSQFGFTKCMKKLIDHGASVNYKNCTGSTALHICSSNGQEAAVELLLAKGADVNSQENEGMTPLMIASNNGHTELVRCLLQNKPKPLLCCLDNIHGNTALHIAAEKGNDEIASLLIDEGAEVDATNKGGRTALHLCGIHGHDKIAQKLVASGADLDLTDQNGHSALALSTQHKQHTVVDFLRHAKDEQADEVQDSASSLEVLTLVGDKSKANQDDLTDAEKAAEATNQVSSIKNQGHGDIEFELLDDGDTEASASLAMKKCEKYPGHVNFIPLPDFNLQHLPERFRSGEMFHYIKAWADLTVKISVKISKDRPHDDPFIKNVGMRITGSAWVNMIDRRNKDCPCEDCETNGYNNRKWWRISLKSATHCVGDESEAKSTRVDFFYDAEDSLASEKMKSLFGVRMMRADIQMDECLMTCATHDDKLVEYLWDKIKQIKRPLPKPANRTVTSDKKVMVCISHPHGKPKHVTVGELVRQRHIPCEKPHQVLTQLLRKYTSQSVEQLLNYSTQTCPGSSGSCVLCLDDITSDDTSERLSFVTVHLSGKKSKGWNTGICTKSLSESRALENARWDPYLTTEDQFRETNLQSRSRSRWCSY